MEWIQKHNHYVEYYIPVTTTLTAWSDILENIESVPVLHIPFSFHQLW